MLKLRFFVMTTLTKLADIEGDLKEVTAEKAKLEDQKKILEDKLKSFDETIEQLCEEIRLLQLDVLFKKKEKNRHLLSWKFKKALP